MLDQTVRIIEEMFTWKSSIDIFFIATGIFFIYHTLRRLGTLKIAVGVFVAILVFVAANSLDLRGTKWIYSNLSEVALIALVIIFQPEIRKFFERAAFRKAHEKAKEGETLIQVVSDSVLILAEQRRGAILVFPGKESIKEWASGGFEINAEPTLPLILSIFDPHSPGHDGAIIFENGKISHFGVRLPLSATNTLSNEFGTRHHAAMGLSEVSDAFIIVVSEERGSVTAFHIGTAKELREKDEIGSRLLSHFENSAVSSWRRSGRRRFMAEAVMSALLAFVLWSSVIVLTTKMIEKGLSAQVEYLVPSQDIVLVGDRPTEVKLLLAGPEADLDRINLSQLAIKVDLSEAKPGEYVFVVEEKQLKLPKSIKLVEAVPSNFVLNLQQILEREATVSPQFVGKISRGLKITAVEINPSKVRILCPADKMKQKEMSLLTTPIYLESIKEDTTLFSQIIAPSGVRSAEGRWPHVEVVIKVSSKR